MSWSDDELLHFYGKPNAYTVKEKDGSITIHYKNVPNLNSIQAQNDYLFRNNKEAYDKIIEAITTSSRFNEPPKPEEKPYEYDGDFD